MENVDSEASLLKSIGKLSIEKVLPQMEDYLKRDYTGARKSGSISHFKLQLLEELIDDLTVPSRAFLHDSVAQLYVSFLSFTNLNLVLTYHHHVG